MLLDKLRHEFLQAQMIKYLVHKNTDCNKLSSYIRSITNKHSNVSNEQTIIDMCHSASKLNKDASLTEFLEYVQAELKDDKHLKKIVKSMQQQSGGGATTVNYISADQMNQGSIYNVAGIVTNINSAMDKAVMGTEVLLRAEQPSSSGVDNVANLGTEALNPITPMVGAKYYGGGKRKSLRVKHNNSGKKK